MYSPFHNLCPSSTNPGWPLSGLAAHLSPCMSLGHGLWSYRGSLSLPPMPGFAGCHDTVRWWWPFWPKITLTGNSRKKWLLPSNVYTGTPGKAPVAPVCVPGHTRLGEMGGLREPLWLALPFWRHRTREGWVFSERRGWLDWPHLSTAGTNKEETDRMALTRGSGILGCTYEVVAWKLAFVHLRLRPFPGGI